MSEVEKLAQLVQGLVERLDKVEERATQGGSSTGAGTTGGGGRRDDEGGESGEGEGDEGQPQQTEWSLAEIKALDKGPLDAAVRAVGIASGNTVKAKVETLAAALHVTQLTAKNTAREMKVFLEAAGQPLPGRPDKDALWARVQELQTPDGDSQIERAEAARAAIEAKRVAARKATEHLGEGARQGGMGEYQRDAILVDDSRVGHPGACV